MSRRGLLRLSCAGIYILEYTIKIMREKILLSAWGVLSVLVVFVSVFVLTAPSHICYGCILEEISPDTIKQLTGYFEATPAGDPFVEADKQYAYGQLTGDRKETCKSLPLYEAALKDYNTSLVYETLFFLSEYCWQDSSKYLDVLTSKNNWKSDFYRTFKDGIKKEVQPVEIKKSVSIPEGAKTISFGASQIDLKELKSIGAQVDRVTRDWYSQNFTVYPASTPSNGYMLSHEGKAVISVLSENTRMKVVPLTGTLVYYFNGEWFAPDDTGTFRFVVGTDKVQYPTTKCYGDFCLIEDTHGISALVSQAVEENVDLVIGCGDNIGKMNAAYYLSQKGISAYFPADRFLDRILFYEGKGTLLGTAPIHDGVIGSQIISVCLEEPIVVEDISKPIRDFIYYDTPAKYFRELEKYTNFNTFYVDVSPGDHPTPMLIKEASERDAAVIALRVRTIEDYDTLRAWLLEDANHRAILFHSSLYPYAQRLFTEFKAQTSFGDPRPVFS